MTTLLQLINKDEQNDEDFMNNLDVIITMNVQIDEEELRIYEERLTQS